MSGTGYVARSSFLHDLDARAKLIALLAIIFLALLLSNPISILALLFVILIAWKAARLPFDTIRGIFKYFTAIALFIFLFQVFFSPGETNLFRISAPVPFLGFSGYITLEGVMYGVALVLRLVVIMAVAPLLIMTTPLSELMLALVKLKIPYRFAFVLTTAMSLLPAIQNRTQLIQQAQLCRGVEDFESKKLFTRLRASASLLVPMILGSFRDSQTLDVAISSRAFGAPVARTFLLESHFTTRDYLVCFGSLIALAAGIVWIVIW